MTPAKGRTRPGGGRRTRQGRTDVPGRRQQGARGKPQRGSSGNTKPSQPTAAPQWPSRPPWTCTTPTACACRSCSRRPR